MNTRFVYSLLGIGSVIVAFIGILYSGGKFFTGSMTPTAPGVAYRFGDAELLSSCVTDAAGRTLIERVYEPSALRPSAASAEWFDRRMREARTERRPLTPRLVERGYLEWRPAESERPYNLTLAGAEKAARALLAATPNTACICYAWIGVLENIVLIRAPAADSAEVMYEPRIITDDHRLESVNFTEPFPFLELLEVQRIRNEHRSGVVDRAHSAAVFGANVLTFEFAGGGLVEHINDAGKSLRRRDMRAPHYQCVRHCIALFD